MTPYLKGVLDAIWPEGMPAGQRVWTLLDGARDQRIYGAILSCRDDYCCLYGGRLAPEIQLVAPYLARLEKEDRFTRYIVNHGWGNGWGIFVRSTADLDTLRTHFRRFLLVKNERGKKLMFRYYDPRVLRVYLPTCLTRELETVFGPVDAFLVEDEDPGCLRQFRRQGAELIQEVFSVAPSESAVKAAAGTT